MNSTEKARKQKAEDPEGYRKRMNEAQRRWYKNNPLAAKAASDNWRLSHPEQNWRTKLRVRAKAKGIPFDEDTSDIVVPEVCPILGIPLIWNTKKVGVPNNPSLDKIVPHLGYVKGNRQVISNRANILKRDATLDELILLGKWAQEQIDRRG